MFLQEAVDLIKEKKLFKKGETIAVAVSGGSDSMALLHFLNEHKEEFDIEVLAITIDHQLRETSSRDVNFVKRFCAQNHIRCQSFKVDVLTYAKEHRMGIEEAARKLRYGIFDKVVKEQHADKIATGHHLLDQAETVLLNMFRGAGLSGVSGMEVSRGNIVRPFLTTKKQSIMAYLFENKVDNIEDETNQDNRFLRNFIRNEVMPLIQTQFRGVETTIAAFAEAARADDEFIGSLAQTSSVLFSDNTAKIPMNYFAQNKSLVVRTIKKTLERMNIVSDITKVHFDMIIDLTKLENGSKVDLPKGLKAIKEYEYITLVKPVEKPKVETIKFKAGKTKIAGFGEILIKKKPYSHQAAAWDLTNITRKSMLVDANKIPKNAEFRKRKEGDVITKFGGGTVTLKKYLIDRKVPERLRNHVPVLAVKNDVLLVLTQDISDKVKVDENTTSVYAIEYNLD